MALDPQRIEDLSRAAEALIAGPPEFLRAFAGDEAGARSQRRSIIIASLREQESEGRVGVSVDDLAADLESVDALRRRLDAAADIVSIDQLALSPQCGFASVAQGNLVSEDDQWRKLERVVETAHQVWG